MIIPLIYSKFPFLLKFLQIKGKTYQMKVVLINFKLIYNSVDVEKKKFETIRFVLVQAEQKSTATHRSSVFFLFFS